MGKSRKYTEKELAAVKATELDILSTIISICEKNGIRYFSVGGTTLGAIRHKGFIPWDDDIDIGMLRADYDRFLEIASEQLPEGFYLLNHDRFKAFPAYFTKVCKKGTLFLEEDAAHLNYEHGIFVDVFPFDFLPDQKAEKKRAMKKIAIYDQLFKSKLAWKISKASTSKHKKMARIARFFLHIFLIPISVNFLYKKLVFHCTRFNGKGYTTISACGKKVLETSVDCIFPTLPWPFETMTIQVPREYQSILTNQYGDYLKLPPLEKRVSHCPIALDLGKCPPDFDIHN